MSLPARGEYTEDQLVEQPTIRLFEELGWETMNCYDEFNHPGGSPLSRENRGVVVLADKLKSALTRLNPDLPVEAIGPAIEELMRDRTIMSMAQANREIHSLIRDGVKVIYKNPEDGSEVIDRVRVIDWNNPSNNDFFLASQFWVTGEMYTRRMDLLGFVNGIPLVFVELKTSHRNIKVAYDDNLSDYKDTVPNLLWYNGFIILSNGSESRIGTITAEWDHFSNWKKREKEREEAVISLETMIRGTCEPRRLLDILENFILFLEVRGGVVKIIAKNHQYLGVNSALEAVDEIEKNRGRLGVFWHTQGSGKSISMIFFSQKILRKRPGNWTFVVLTDRKELDDQIFKTFSNAGVVTDPEARAVTSKHLRQLLTEDHRYIFTLIHKFRVEKSEQHPRLSDRSDIIVIADEAHRTQYDTLAMNMRTALPNAAFIAFTGTPLMVGEERTKETFGDYVSIYNFRQSTDDHATVPIFYENRIPSVQLRNEDLNEQVYGVLEEIELEEVEEKKLERELSRQYEIITRESRLETVAKDIVSHFMNRGFHGKALVVSIDKATAVKMFDKVKKHWDIYAKELKQKLDAVSAGERTYLEEEIRYMEETDMAVVVSQSQGEIKELREKGVEITPHRIRMNKEDLATMFKDPNNPLRIAFVCAMWTTGFDVPSCSTIYLEKPMKNHTLMQTIARANRVFPDKYNGLIVDYVGILNPLQKALAIYGSESGGGVGEGDKPALDKARLVESLVSSVNDTEAFFKELDIDVESVLKSEGFDRIRLLDDAVDVILVGEKTKNQYLALAVRTEKLYKAILPDPRANKLAPKCTLISVLSKKIHSLTSVLGTSPEIAKAKRRIGEILDISILAQGYSIETPGHILDLSELDIEALRTKFVKKRKHIEAERLKALLLSNLKEMIRLNRSRMDYMEKYQEMIEEYNLGSADIDELFRKLIEFAKELREEDKRTIVEGLTEEELAIFDLLTKPEMDFTESEVKRVKQIAKHLLEKLKEEKLVLDWRKVQKTRASVKVAVEETLDELPDRYTREIYRQKCNTVYEHIYDSYYGAGQSIYASA